MCSVSLSTLLVLIIRSCYRCCTIDSGVKVRALKWVVRVLSQWSNTNLPGSKSCSRTVDCSVPQRSVLGPQKSNAYTENLANLIDDHHLDHHMYADNTQHVVYNGFWHSECHHKTAKLCWSYIRVVQIQETAIKSGENRTDLVQIKREFEENCSSWSELVFWSHHKAVGVVRDLGVFLDSELNMDQHVKTVVRSSFFHLRHLKSVRRILGREVTLGLVSAFVTTRLDYCNSLLVGLPQATIDPLQQVQNAAARLVVLLELAHGIPSLLFSEACIQCIGFRSSCAYNRNCASLCTWCASVAILPTWLTWWQSPPIYPVVRDFVPPTVSDAKPHKRNSSLASGVSNTLDQRLGTLFHPIFRNLRTLILFKNNWKLTCLSPPIMIDEYWLCWCTTGHFRCKRRCEIM